MSPEKVNLPEQPEITDKDIASKESLQQGGEELATVVGKKLKQIDPNVNQVINYNIQSNRPENGAKIDKVDNHKVDNHKEKTPNSQEKTPNSQEKVNGIIGRGIIESKEPISLNVGSRVYQSIDNYNPPIDSSKDNTKQLHKLKEKAKADSNIISVKGQLEELTPEETKKVESIIQDVYSKNRESINKELGIKDLKHLNPSQAAKLASLVTMAKLDYDNTQAINPGGEDTYMKKLTPEEQLNYKKDYYASKVLKELSQNKGFHDKYWENQQAVFEYLKKSSPEELSSLSIEGINGIISGDVSSRIKRNGFGEEKSNQEDYNLFTYYATFSNSFKQNDNKPVSELLKGGKGVCRNYGAANVAIFKVLKSMQGDDSKLNSSILTANTGNKSDGSKKSNIADTENDTNHHLRNELQTIGSDGNIYVSQIDPTMSDSNKGSNIDKVRTLDKTYDRLLNDLANNTDKKDFSKLGVKIEDYIGKLSKKSGNETKVSAMNIKLYHYYKGVGDNSGLKRIEDKLINTPGKDNLNDRLSLANYYAKTDLKKSIQLLGNDVFDTNEGLIKTLVYATNGTIEEYLGYVDKFVSKNPDFLTTNKLGRDNLLRKLSPSSSERLISSGITSDDFIQKRYKK